MDQNVLIILCVYLTQADQIIQAFFLFKKTTVKMVVTIINPSSNHNRTSHHQNMAEYYIHLDMYNNTNCW